MAAARRTPSEQRELNDLLTRDHTLNGAILFGLDGHVTEMQAPPDKVNTSWAHGASV